MLARFLVLTLFLSPAALAATADTTDNTAAPEADAAAPASTPVVSEATITDLIEATQELERNHGPFDTRLGENLVVLGLAHQQNGDHELASEQLGRALHITRVNNGLQNLGQISILEELIESNIASENWEELDRNYQLLLWLHRRNFDPDDPRFLPIIDKMGRWKLQAYARNLLKQHSSVTLREAEQLYKKTIDLLEERHGEHDPRLVDPLYGSALAGYQLVKETLNKPLEDFSSGAPTGTVTTQTYQQVCRSTQFGVVCSLVPVRSRNTNIGAYLSRQQTKNQAIYSAMQRVRFALDQIVEIYEANPDLPRTDFGIALIHLGDWHMYAGRRITANQHYSRAYSVIADTGASPEEIDEIFGHPVSIPSLRLGLSDVEGKFEEEQDYVNVAFDVTKAGKVRNVEILEGAEDSPHVRRRIMDMLRGGTFRPRIENGEPVDTEGIELRIAAPT